VASGRVSGSTYTTGFGVAASVFSTTLEKKALGTLTQP